MAEETKAIKERLDVLEAAMEAAGYLVWSEKKAAFVSASTAAEDAAKTKAEATKKPE